VKALLTLGIQPDMLVCRSNKRLSNDIRKKIALFCNVEPRAVISAYDSASIYEVPLILHKEKFDKIVAERLELKKEKIDLEKWEAFVDKIKNPTDEVKIAICGKYIDYRDAYKSIIESFTHAGAENQAKVNITWVDSENVEEGDVKKLFKGIHGLLIPGGFGERGIQGKIDAITYARENNIPFFGICLGLQCAVIEFARNVCGIENANSSEFDKNSNSVIDIMPDQVNIENKGGTMRLGSWDCKLKPGTKAAEAYGVELIKERHRHRFEVNNDYRDILSSNGLLFSGTSPDGHLVEMIELPDHPWFLGCQFHPELKSRATKAHPLFREFVKAAIEYKTGK
jgi:CTP synthase